MYACNKKKKNVHVLKELELTDIFQGSKSTIKKDVALLSTKKEKKKKKTKEKEKESSTHIILVGLTISLRVHLSIPG